MRWLKWFAAGALAVPVFHQIALRILNAVGYVERAPFSFASTKPFGVPSLLSLSFWGGVWGILLGLLLARMRGTPYWITAVVFGAIAPTLVAIFVVAPLKGQAAGGDVKMAVAGLVVNAAWGLGTAAIFRLLNGRNV